MPSSIGPALDGLVTLCAAACPAATVSDGWPLDISSETDIVSVGGTVDPDAEGTTLPIQIGGHSIREDFLVPVTVYVWGGDTDQKALRDRAVVYYDAIIGAWQAQMISRSGIWFAADMVHPESVRYSQTDRESLSDGQPWFSEIVITFRFQKNR